MDVEILKSIVEILQAVILLVGIFVYIKKGQYDEAAEVIESVFHSAVSDVQSKEKQLVDKVKMKEAAVALVKSKLRETEIVDAVKKVGVELDDTVVGTMIEKTLSSGKLGVENPIKKILKNKGKGYVLGFFKKKFNKITI